MQKGIAQVYLLIILLLVGVGGYLYFTKSSTKPVIPQPTPSVTPTKAVDETANWKTYTSTTLGFSIKYPSDAKITEQQNGSVSLLIWGPTQKANTEFYDGVNLNFNADSLKGQTLKAFTDKRVEDSKINGEILIPLKPTTIGAVEGYMFRASGLGEHNYTFLPSKSGEYFEIINSTNDPTNKGFVKTADQILSTFKFVSASDGESQNSRDKTANWKTYTNETYKFSFKYPETAAIQEVSPVYLRISDKNNITLPSILIFLSKNIEGLSRRDFFAKSVSSKIEDILPYINIQETAVGNVPALRIVQDQEYYKKQSTAYTNYLVSAGGNIIQIVTNEYVGKNNGQSTEVVKSSDSSTFYQEILSTFKSTD